MKITELSIKDFPPIDNFKIESLGNIVIIAGANGSGKTRLKDALKNTFQNPKTPQVSLKIESTREEEKDKIGKTLKVIQGQPATTLHEHMESRTRGGSYTSTVIQIDSDRSVESVKFDPINLSTPDPDDVEIDCKYFLNSFKNRWQLIVNKIHQKAANKDNKIVSFVKDPKNSTLTSEQILAKFPDPFLPYQKLFSKLLPGKQLEPINPEQPREFHYKINGSNSLAFNTLSSGEQEVIKITFDLLWKKISHSIFLIDEPELHLHPTLAFKLIETLKGMGGGTNQFIFFTHSADLISTYYSTGNVFLIGLGCEDGNQAHRLSDLREEHPELIDLLSGNLGIFAVGKKIIFVEGDEASLDRLAYHTIAQQNNLDFVFSPVGSVENLLLLENTLHELKKSVFGIKFYMIRDRDGLADGKIAELEAKTSLKCLKRRHIENYFLDSEVLSKVADRFCLSNDWKKVKKIDAELLNICNAHKNEALDALIKDYLKTILRLPIPKLKEIQKITVAELKSGFQDKIEESVKLLGTKITKFESVVKGLENQLNDSIKDGSWVNTFPGKIIFREICVKMKVEQARLRQAYIEVALEVKPEVFKDILEIFEQFK